MMQALGRLYVRYFNSEYKRSGTLWEGRYKSCLVESSTYLLKVDHTLFEHDINDREMELIRSAANKGMVVGNDRSRK